MTIRGWIQGSKLGARVFLYWIDLSMFGEEDLFITGGPDGGSALSFGDQIYSPWPVIAEGFETTTGKLPEPSFALANVAGILNALVEQHDDLIGARVTRIRTYERYLDGHEEPNGDAHLPLDVYEFAKITGHDDEQIQWKLSALIDQEGVTLPGRTCVRDYCDHLVRRFIDGDFDYTLATCPFTDADGPPRDINGDVCDPEDEVFSKRLETCCKARFGANAALPFRGFPGVARLRTR